MPRPRSETAAQIVDLAEMLIQDRGYSAFSYQDIADSLGIRSAGWLAGNLSFPRQQARWPGLCLEPAGSPARQADHRRRIAAA
jgi:hypothetical protein